MKAIAVMAILTSLAGCSRSQDQQFNLRCKGTQTTDDRSYKSPPRFEEVYRFDLDAKKYCVGKCEQRFAVQAASPDEIKIAWMDDTAFKLVATINRQTGDFAYQSMWMGVSVWQFGNCSKEPFTGFPEPKF